MGRKNPFPHCINFTQFKKPFKAHINASKHSQVWLVLHTDAGSMSAGLARHSRGGEHLNPGVPSLDLKSVGNEFSQNIISPGIENERRFTLHPRGLPGLGRQQTLLDPECWDFSNFEILRINKHKDFTHLASPGWHQDLMRTSAQGEGKNQKGSLKIFNKTLLYLLKQMCSYNAELLPQWQQTAFSQFLVKLPYFSVEKQMDLVHHLEINRPGSGVGRNTHQSFGILLFTPPDSYIFIQCT